MLMARPTRVHTDIWTDAAAMAAGNPNTFVAPLPPELRAVHPGSVVKICNGQERFWVTISAAATDRHTGRITFRGRVVHRLMFEAPYDRDDLVEFEDRHVYSVKFAQAQAPGPRRRPPPPR